VLWQEIEILYEWRDEMLGSDHKTLVKKELDELMSSEKVQNTINNLVQKEGFSVEDATRIASLILEISIEVIITNSEKKS
jgi:hypothetical protein